MNGATDDAYGAVVMAAERCREVMGDAQAAVFTLEEMSTAQSRYLDLVNTGEDYAQQAGTAVINEYMAQFAALRLVVEELTAARIAYRSKMDELMVDLLVIVKALYGTAHTLQAQ